MNATNDFEAEMASRFGGGNGAASDEVCDFRRPQPSTPWLVLLSKQVQTLAAFSTCDFAKPVQLIYRLRGFEEVSSGKLFASQGATDGDDDALPATTVRTRYERMLKERERRPDGDPGTPGGSQVVYFGCHPRSS